MTLSFATTEEATNWAPDWLRREGFSCYDSATEEWLKPADLARAHGLSTKQIFSRLHSRRCPRTPRREGERGRLVTVLVTPALTEFLKGKR